MRFYGHVPNLPINRNSKRLIPYTQKNGFFGLQYSVVSLGHRGKTFPSTLNVMILQTIMSECVRFVGHGNIQVSYKILRLKVLNETPILHSPPYFQQGLF
jgi:hypothetical protein